jgi:DNA-binding NarL/FixJ family response regulator
MQKVRLMIVSEREMMHRGLEAILSSDPSFEIIGGTNDPEESVEEAREIQPDLVLFEPGPEGDGLAAVRRLKEACPCTAVVVFTDGDGPEEIRAAVKAGADGCLTKRMLPGQLKGALELICRAGVFCLPGSLRRFLGCEEKSSLSPDQNGSTGPSENGAYEGGGEPGGRFPLTARELEVYRLLVQNYSNKEIARTLFISEPTVKSHVSSILRKLGLTSRTQIILNEIQKGNRYSPPLCVEKGRGKVCYSEVQVG